MADQEPPRAGGRDDLAALLEPLRQALLKTEMEILTGHDLSMWAYVVLRNLSEEPIRTQAALADAINADRTRIIGVLDGLQERGLIARVPDPADRRARLLSLTVAGRQLRAAVQAQIQDREDQLLAILGPGARAGFLNALRLLTGPQALAQLSLRS